MKKNILLSIITLASLVSCGKNQTSESQTRTTTPQAEALELKTSNIECDNAIRTHFLVFDLWNNYGFQFLREEISSQGYLHRKQIVQNFMSRNHMDINEFKQKLKMLADASIQSWENNLSACSYNDLKKYEEIFLNLTDTNPSFCRMLTDDISNLRVTSESLSISVSDRFYLLNLKYLPSKVRRSISGGSDDLYLRQSYQCSPEEFNELEQKDPFNVIQFTSVN